MRAGEVIERVRSKKERVYYFFIDAWDEEPKLCLMERGIKHARVVAEILAPPEMVRRCVKEQGKVALFERTHPINEELKQWLIANVMESENDARVILMEIPEDETITSTGLPGRDDVLAVPERGRFTRRARRDERRGCRCPGYPI